MKNDLGFKYKEYKIITKEELTPDTFLFRIEGELRFNPGQFVQVALDRIGEGTFAPCSSINNKNYFELCVRACGNLSNQITRLLPCNYLKIRGPYGKGWPVGKLIGKNILIICGGMGLIPLRPLLYELEKYKKEFRSIKIITGFKSPHHILFESDLLKFSKIFDCEVFVEYTDKGFWGKKGLITKPINKLKTPQKNTVALICGPEVMYAPTIEILKNKEILEKNIFISFERRMECGIGICQHCNIGKYLVCQDGPVFSLDKIRDELNK